MMTSPIPQNYAEWQHCITVECDIPLTTDFVAQRLLVLRDGEHPETRRFQQRYGDTYLQTVVGWFEKAEQELGATSQ